MGEGGGGVDCGMILLTVGPAVDRVFIDYC